jgi:urea carboxylase
MEIDAQPGQPHVVYRKSGTDYILIEYGELILDINMRLRVHALEKTIEDMRIDGVMEMSPGVRSLLIHYDGLRLSLTRLLDILGDIEKNLTQLIPQKINSRLVNLPIACRESSVREALEKYMNSVRREGPYLPDNVEFIARCNGLSGPEDVITYLQDSQYLVLGLGDVYLGAPCATALDPRRRMIVPKFNPARFWTAEGTVGLGGAFLCIYPMCSPGGYQLIGRTLPIWNTFQTSRTFKDAPWLLRNFDRIQFWLVSEEELIELREKALGGAYEFDIIEDTFDIVAYNQFIDKIKPEINEFRKQQQDSVKTATIGY